MTIESPIQLAALLSDTRSLDDHDRMVMMDTARFLPGGPIASLYLRAMIEKCTPQEINEFFRRADAFIIVDGRRYGAQAGDQVYYHYRETGRDDIPCEPQPYFSCWVRAGHPWRPDINRPFPPFR